MATLTYVYADQTAVLGPLATYAEPHSYDLCAEHTKALTAPRGWEVVRLAIDFDDPTGTVKDMTAIADAVSARSGLWAGPQAGEGTTDPLPLVGDAERRGHLRLLREAQQPAGLLRQDQGQQEQAEGAAGGRDGGEGRSGADHGDERGGPQG